MTLEELETDYQIARCNYLGIAVGEKSNSLMGHASVEAFFAWVSMNLTALADQPEYHSGRVREAHDKTKIYLVARDEGLDAAMLWKLSNGL